MPAPALTRRSRRQQTAESSLVGATTLAAPADIPTVPLSRRALRERQLAATVADEPAIEQPQSEHAEANEPAPRTTRASIRREAAKQASIEQMIVEWAATQKAADTTVTAAPAVPDATAVPDAPAVPGASVVPAVTAVTVVPAVVIEPAVTVVPVVSEKPTATVADVDAFDTASRAFRSATGDQPICMAIPAEEKPHYSERLPSGAYRTPQRERRGGMLFAVGATVGIMGIAGMLAVSMTVPAGAVAIAQSGQFHVSTSLVAASKQSGSSAGDDEIQAYVASSGFQNDEIRRAEGFSTASLIDLATEQGITYSSSVYTNDPDAAIQWPFIVGVGMSYGYGVRDGRLHEGLDLVPGSGAPVQAIAGGKVRIATESGGNYGVTVYIDHMIDGELITSHYSHMQYDSLQVEAGDVVEVGDIIGKVGNTGRSFGAHMHFELIVDGATIDPLPWLQEHAGRYDGVSPVS
ncbi:peptidoglycan DD-metalloendopeptidase family protein [Microbacterium sp.]|uniref:M23 family metallopeptidase n=1 Tax=Microbacterium sp. TaxID=51671 RepID=UPI003F97926C